MMLLTATIACFVLGANTVLALDQEEEHDNDKLLVTLFYESYCPYCNKYLGEQLVPAWRRFHANLTLDLVPFGNARQWYADGHFKFECQHGPKECLANKLHACAIQQACGAAGTKRCGEKDVSRALAYVHCLEQVPDQEEANDKCATSAQLKPGEIAECADSAQGDRLLSLYGNQTAAFTPQIEGVPTVALDGKNSAKAADDLVGAICSVRPSLCSGLEK